MPSLLTVSAVSSTADTVARSDSRAANPGWRLAGRISERIATGLLVIWATATSTFIGFQLVPGDPADIIAGDTNYEGLTELIRAEWGLDRSPWEQYLDFLGRAAGMDFGTSYILQQPVSVILEAAIGPTIQLALAASILSLLIAFTAAVVTSGRSRILRGLVSGTEVVLASVPVFVLGMLLLFVFSFQLAWFPVAGAGDLSALVLPAVSLAVIPAVIVSQVLRESLDRIGDEPFVQSARARGLSRTAVLFRHSLKHALLPVMSLTGVVIASLLGGAVIVERVFGRPGLGTVIYNAVSSKDVPVVIGGMLFIAAACVIVSTIVDIACVLIDSRLKASRDGTV